MSRSPQNSACLAEQAVCDRLNRPLRDLRVSVVEQCNFRCPYCMPEDQVKDHSFPPSKECLSNDELLRLIRVFCRLGVKKVRLTGGEPLLRPGLIDLVDRLSGPDGPKDLALTTNGLLLDRHADRLFRAGLRRLTVSLDALRPEVFRRMSGGRGSLHQVLEGISAAGSAGFQEIKINMVVKRGMNEEEIFPLVERFRGTAHILRFIEYMDVGNCNHWNHRDVVRADELMRSISARYPLEPVRARYYGEVARRYRYRDGSGEIGFITSISQPFCESCTRARLTSDGRMLTCLFARKGFDLKHSLRSGLSDDDLSAIIRGIWEGREDQYSRLRSQFFKDYLHRKKMEMFQVGG